MSLHTSENREEAGSRKEKNGNESPLRVAVIGAGASGMMAAIAAARAGAAVTLLEQNQKPGKKLLVTGNGRCNLTNLDEKLWERYHSSDPEALSQCCGALRRKLDVQDTLRFFRQIGLLTTHRDGYVYPLSNCAQSVLHVLEREMERLGVRRKYAGRVTGLAYAAPCRDILPENRVDAINGDSLPEERVDHSRRDRRECRGLPPSGKGEWSIQTASYTYSADRVILAAGSKAGPDTGSDGGGYELARQLGHTIIRPVPALTALKSNMKGLEKAAGSRSAARIEASDPETGETVSQAGQVQWNRDGIAGIVVFQVSGFVAERLASGRRVSVSLDLLPDMDARTASAFLEEQLARQGSAGSVLKGILPERLALFLYQMYAGKTEKKCFGTCQGEAEALAGFLKRFPVPATGVRGFEQAQVCRGGVGLGQVDPVTLESRLVPGLYLAGEILDADGPCGGYNLQWAWSSGYAAGSAAGSARDRRDGSVREP